MNVLHERCPGIDISKADVVDSVYPLADIAAAHEAFERGGVVGKHVVAVSA